MENFTTIFLQNNANLYLSNNQNIEYSTMDDISLDDIAFYHVSEVTFENNAPKREAIENVIGALRIQGIHFVYLVVGDAKGVKFYYGISKDVFTKNPATLSIDEIGETVLLPSLKGNFNNDNIALVEKDEKAKILNNMKNMEHCSYLEGVSGVSDNSSCQGVDKLVDVMLGDEFSLVVIAKPMSLRAGYYIENNLNNAYSSMSPFAKETSLKGTSTNNGKSTTTTNETNDTKGTSSTKAEQENSRYSETETKGITETELDDAGDSEARVANTATEKGKTKGTTIASSVNSSKGSSHAIGKTTNSGDGTIVSRTRESVKKEIQYWMSYIDETVFPKFDYSKGKGLFVATSFLATNTKGSLLKIENTVKSIYSSKSGNKVSIQCISLENDVCKTSYLKNLQLPKFKLAVSIEPDEVYVRSVFSQYMTIDTAYLGNWVSSKELSLVSGLPKKDVVGFKIRDKVAFGVNVKNDCDDNVNLGKIMKNGQQLNIPATVKKSALSKHTFVTGVLGSGKTTTCQKMLIDSELPFLVIDPAKKEYRALTEKYNDLLIFTLGNDNVAPFRLNPLEFLPNESVTSRVDMIKANFEANFDMGSDVIELIETALYKCYKDCGWNVFNDKNRLYKNPFADGVFAFPTLSDLVAKVEKIVNEQIFDDKLKKDYISFIKSKLQGLMVGAKGLMLNTKRSVDFKSLLKNKVVLELEAIKNSAEKSLIMGFLVTNLVQAVKENFDADNDFKHVTLIEDAHRIFRKYDSWDAKKRSVETFTDMLAEVNDCGECLIMTDQTASKLSPDVFRNVHTKIVHKVFAADDKEMIADFMALTDEQKGFLSGLEVGHSILLSEGYDKAVQIKVESHNMKCAFDNDEIRKSALSYYVENYKQGAFSVLKYLENKPSLETFEILIDLNCELNLLEAYYKFLKGGTAELERFKKEVTHLRAGLTHLDDSVIDEIFIAVLCNYPKNDSSIDTVKKLYYYCVDKDNEFNMAVEKSE